MENNTLEIEKTKFKEKMFFSMKENLILSIVAFLWNKIIDEICNTEIEKQNLQKDFINLWKDNVNKITQEQLKSINNILNESNIDMLNIITGDKNVADIEDYQSIINENIKEIEKIFWKICGKE